jgi:hypothetical protein
MNKYKIEMKFEEVQDTKRQWTELKLEDRRANQIDLKTIAELLLYVEERRIRKSLPSEFIELLYEDCEELLLARENNEPVSYKHLIEQIYILLYDHYPRVKRNFFDCLSKRRKRLDEQGRTKVEANRAKRLKIKRADVLESNKKKYRTRIEDSYLEGEGQTFDKINDIMNRVKKIAE